MKIIWNGKNETTDSIIVINENNFTIDSNIFINTFKTEIIFIYGKKTLLIKIFLYTRTILLLIQIFLINNAKIKIIFIYEKKYIVD